MTHPGNTWSCLFCALALCPLLASGEQPGYATRSVAAFVKERITVTPALTQNLSARIRDGGRSAVVHFAIGGALHQYKLSLFSVYASGGKALAHTDAGLEELSTRPSQTFESRIDGNWASATLHDDGTVSGIFEYGGHFLELRPPDPTSLLATPNGGAAAHQVLYHSLQDISLSSSMLSPSSLLQEKLDSKDGDDDTADAPRIIRDIDHRHADGHHDIFHVPPGGGKPSDLKPNDISSQSLAKWWPGCFPGDSKQHTFIVGIVGDHPAFQFLGAKLQSRMESDVAEASIVYEKQLNIRLKIGGLKIYKSASGAPGYATGCGKNFMDKKLDNFPDGAGGNNGAGHLFTGCGNGFGTVGLAWYGSACGSQNTGATQLRTSNSWLTFAHELGHNFHGDHSFEKGQGKTGGIMDYGDGKLRGVYQFNTKYRKQEMCTYLKKKVGKCRGNFDRNGEGGGGGEVGGEGPGKGGKGGKGGTPSPSPSPSPEDPGQGGKGGKGGKGDVPSPTPTPSSPSPTPSPSPEDPGQGGKGGKGGKGDLSSPSPLPSPAPAPSPAMRRRRNRRRRRRSRE